MAILKYKNGSTWKEVNVSGSADIDKIYPIGSVYLKLYNSISGSRGNYKWDSSHYSQGVTDISSPAEEIGGNWILVNSLSTFNPLSSDFSGWYANYYGILMSFPTFYVEPYRAGYYITQTSGKESGFSPLIYKSPARWSIEPMLDSSTVNRIDITGEEYDFTEYTKQGQLIGWVRIS